MSDTPTHAESVVGLEHFQVLRLEPGDVLVLTYLHALSADHAEHLEEKLRREFPGHKAVVIDSGGQFGVIREERTDDV